MRCSEKRAADVIVEGPSNLDRCVGCDILVGTADVDLHGGEGVPLKSYVCVADQWAFGP